MYMKTLSAGLLALTLGFTSIAPTQARADITEDQIVGLLSILALGALIHNRSRDDGAAPEHTRPQHSTPQRPIAQPNRRVLPANCVRQIERRNGNFVRMLPRRCLIRENVRINRLPQACHVRFTAANGNTRQGFRVRCLRNEGFRIGNR